MAWATAGNIDTSNLNAGTDSPADARPNLKAALDELSIVANNLGETDGAAKIESDGTISSNVTKVSTSTGGLTVTSATGLVSISNFINLSPIAYAALPGSPNLGDIVFLTTDGAGATKNQLIFWNGSAWKYVTDATTTVAAS